MSFSNLEYLYDHLPARYRREDKDLFLKRFLSHFGDTLDSYDEAFDAFYQSIASGTANAQWVTFWLDALFGWPWFPWWFTLADKRNLYGNFARHLARRGTRRGIELFLLDFGIVARVHTRSQPWGEFVWGETSFAFDSPLYIVVEILSVKTPPSDADYWDEGVWGEMIYTEPVKPMSEADILNLIKFQQPHSQVIDVVWRLKGYEAVDYTPVWGQISW